MPEQDPHYYAAQTRTFPLDDTADPYTPRKDRVKRTSRFAGLEKLVIKGCDPRYELEVTEQPLIAAQRFSIRLSKEEREALKVRPRALQLAINQLYWDVNSSGDSLTPMEKLLIKGCNERHREIVGTDPIGAARQFKIKLTEVDHILLSGIRQQDLSRAINAAKKHLIKGNKCVIGHRLRLQQGRRGKILSLCAVTQSRRDAVETRKRISTVIQELFDLSKPLPSGSSESVFYFRDNNNQTNYFVRKRRLRRANRRAQRADERRARRLSSRRAKNISRSERRRTRTYSPPPTEGAPAGGGGRRRRRRRTGPNSSSNNNSNHPRTNDNQARSSSNSTNRDGARGRNNSNANASYAGRGGSNRNGRGGNDHRGGGSNNNNNRNNRGYGGGNRSGGNSSSSGGGTRNNRSYGSNRNRTNQSNSDNRSRPNSNNNNRSSNRNNSGSSTDRGRSRPRRRNNNNNQGGSNHRGNNNNRNSNR